MFLNTANLRAHIAASQNGRYALNAIALGLQGALSSDGHALLFVPYPEVDAKEAPVIAGVAPTPATDRPALLDPKDAAKAAAMLGKRRHFGSPFCELVQVEVRGEEIVMGATDLAACQTMTARQVEGQFPSVTDVIPDYGSAHAVTLELKQLLRSIKALCTATKSDTVTLRLIDDQHALGLSCRDGTAMLVMPVQVDTPQEHCPDQLAKLRHPDGPEGPKEARKPSQDDPEGEMPAEEGYEPTEAEMEAAYASMGKLPA
ncbi:MAG: hypothetical protein IPP14_05825 [Planctomycetes bacterium]|nr:hypothetical protein [Planctomycetota bacterium]